MSLMIGRVIVDELHKLDAKQCDDAADAASSASRLPRRRCPLAVDRNRNPHRRSYLERLSQASPNEATASASVL